MNVEFSSSFLADLERIDNTVLIDNCRIYNDESYADYIPEVIYNEKSEVCQACIVGSEEGGNWECDKLEFYYVICGETKLAFTITNESQKIVLNRYRTIFELSLSSQATIGCPGLSEDTKFLEEPGLDLGSTLYKDIKVSEDSTLVWKESVGKYIMDKGLQEDHQFDIELMDTKAGYLEERPIKFKSYQNIVIEQGSLKIDTLKRTVYEKHEVYSKISSTNFFVWDSPMIDAKVNLEITPTCYNNLGVYLDPGKVVFGNTESLEFINYPEDQLKGFRITGTEGTIIEILLNKEYSGGDYVKVRCEIDSEGVSEVTIPDLPFYHLNGIVSSGPCKVDLIEVISLIEEPVDSVVPNPDNTYLAEIGNVDAIIKIDGVCDYIEYEKYLGKITEIGRGVEHINSIPTLDIIDLEGNGLVYSIDNLGRQIKCKPNESTSNKVFYEVFQAVIKSNLAVSGNTITTSILRPDYKIKVEQSDIVWRFADSPDYIMEEDGDAAIFVLGYKKQSTKQIKILTNRLDLNSPLTVSMKSASSSVFSIPSSVVGEIEEIDGREWLVHTITITTKTKNESDEWRPKNSSSNPYKVNLKYDETIIESISFYAIQLSEIEPRLELWEETLPGKFTQVGEDKIRIFDSMVKNFIVVKPGNPVTDEKENWYYYDLTLTNKFHLTDFNSILTNTGVIYIDDGSSDIISLGTNLDRETYEKVINVNRSDLVGSIGTLTITNSQSYPLSWRSLIEANTINVEVIRELTNIYIQVGTSEGEIEDNDFVLMVSKIGVYSIYVRSNFKYTISVNSESEYLGFLEFDDEEQIIDFGERQVFSGYNSILKYDFALLKLDEEGGIEESWIEIRSGSVVRRITLKVVGPETTHSYYTENITKPNLIRVFDNGTISPQSTQKQFIYSSTTTPDIVYNNINKSGEEDTEVVFIDNSDPKYKYHKSKISFTVSGSSRLSYSKYPIKSFGGISEKSLSYSDKELNPLEYYFYMKGKEHFLWCVDTLADFSGLVDPVDYTSETVPEGYDKEDLDTDEGELETEKNVYIDAAGDSGKDLYILSRYGISNKTFITEYPKESEVKIKRNDLEATLKISPQEKLSLDERTQIEYAIPIRVECNVQNNHGGVYLGSVEYIAKTNITDFSIEDVIDVPTEIIDEEKINGEYIRNYIVGNKIQVMPINIFQRGEDKKVFSIFTDLIDVGYLGYSQYLIPEIGENIRFTSFGTPEITKEEGPDIKLPTVEMKTISDRYYYLKVNCENRDYNGVKNPSQHTIDNGPRWWYDNIPNTNKSETAYFPLNYFVDIVHDVEYTISVRSTYVELDENGEAGSEKSITLTSRKFTRYGSHTGLYVSGDYGFGWVNSPEERIHYISPVPFDAEGGRINICAGIFDAINAPMGGRLTTQALKVPAQYEFIGENIPEEVIWEDGNADNDEGNLVITIPPRLRDDYGYKEFILHVSQPDEYYPLNLYVGFQQKPLIEDGGDLDTNKNDYKLVFEGRDEINVYSNGEVDGSDKLYFTHNLTEDMFNSVVFEYENKNSLPKVPDDLRDLEEIERSYKEGYVRFKFKPNGSKTSIDTNIQAIYTCDKGPKVIGSIPIKQGYYCLTATLYNPYFSDKIKKNDVEPVYKENYLSRESLKLIKDLYTNYTYSYHEVPCWTNNDNSEATEKEYSAGRGVFTLKAYRQEFFQNTESEVTVNTVFKESNLIYTYPEPKFESIGVSFNPSNDPAGSDPDARVRTYDTTSGYSYPRGWGNITTGTNFSTAAPYIEFNYICKDEYIRQGFSMSEACKITLIEEDTNNPVDFYLATTSFKRRSDQASVNLEEISLSTTDLRFTYEEGKDTVLSHPYLYMSCDVVDSESWINVTGSSTTRIEVGVNNNWSTVARSGQVSVNALDIRTWTEDGQSKTRLIVLKSFIVQVYQDPVNVVISDSVIRFGCASGTKNVYIYPNILSSTTVRVDTGGSSWVTVSSSVGKVVISVDSNYSSSSSPAYFRTAQVYFNVSKDGNVLGTYKVNVEQDSDLTNSGGGGGDDPDPTDLPLISNFNDILESQGKSRVTEEGTPTTYKYLSNAVRSADSEWSSGSLFNIVAESDVEIVSYRDPNDGDRTYESKAKDAMYSWLYAMSLSELVPSYSSSTTDINNQTRLFKEAYELGGGRSVPLYGNYTPKGDVMVARLVAATIWAKNRSNYTFSRIDTMRTELGGSAIDKSVGWADMGYVKNTRFGYLMDLNNIFPAAPGPYANGYDGGRTRPSQQGQGSEGPGENDIFYGSGNQNSWYNYNYKVDVAVDTTVTTNYNLQADDQYLERTVQAVADDDGDVTHLFGEKTYYKCDTTSEQTVQGQVVHGPRFTFSTGTSADNNGCFYGTFGSEVTGKDLSSILTEPSSSGDDTETDFSYFMGRAYYLGGHCRQPLLDPNFGRRRPAQGENEPSARVSSGADYRYNWLNDESIARLVGGGTKYDSNGQAYHFFWTDVNGNGQYDARRKDVDGKWVEAEPYYLDGHTLSEGDKDLYPSDVSATTYPSGHSSGCWAVALYTIMFYPDKYKEIFKAAYKFSVSRTIVRAHWNSDVTYGRVIGTMMVPISHATREYTSRYNNYRTLWEKAIEQAGGHIPDDSGVDEKFTAVYNYCKSYPQTEPSYDLDYLLQAPDNNGKYITFRINNNTGKHVLWNGRFDFFVLKDSSQTEGDRHQLHAFYRVYNSSDSDGTHILYVDPTNYLIKNGTYIDVRVPLKRQYDNINIEGMRLATTIRSNLDYFRIYISRTKSSDDALHNSSMDIVDPSILNNPVITNGDTYNVMMRADLFEGYPYYLNNVSDYDTSRQYVLTTSGSGYAPVRLSDWAN